MDIIFTNIGGVPEEYYPKPASKFIPDWYKNIESYIGGKKAPINDGQTSATIKRCMPVFDVITAGYIIVSPADVYVSQRDGQPYYEWSGFDPIQWHPGWQAPDHPHNPGLKLYPKWINPWGIQTPKGYSSLFIQPVHRESVFTILPGLVDTDTYSPPVNFPFILDNPKFEGMIPAGTPIAQVIPIKRDNWKMKLGGKQEFNKQKKIQLKMSTVFFDRYKIFFRQNKEYK